MPFALPQPRDLDGNSRSRAADLQMSSPRLTTNRHHMRITSPPPVLSHMGISSHPSPILLSTTGDVVSYPARSHVAKTSDVVTWWASHSRSRQGDAEVDASRVRPHRDKEPHPWSTWHLLDHPI
jgi:hypothetical protein